MKKIFLGLSMSLSGIVFCHAQQNNDSMKTAKKMIGERQSQSDRMLEQKIKKQNLVLKSLSIPGSETDKITGSKNPGKKN